MKLYAYGLENSRDSIKRPNFESKTVVSFPLGGNLLDILISWAIGRQCLYVFYDFNFSKSHYDRLKYKYVLM